MGVEVDGKGGVGVDVVLLQWPMGELEVMQRRTDCTSVAATAPAPAPFLQPHEHSQTAPLRRVHLKKQRHTPQLTLF
jgi:hypothetical protein